MTSNEQGPSGVQALFAPRSIALVGASGRPDTIPGRLLSFLLQGGFTGPIFPVNPRYEELGGQRCYPSLRAIGEPVDLVLVMVPAAMAGDVIDECGEVSAGVAVLFGSGFSETGQEGAAAEADLLERARRAGVRLLGPNCQGVISGAVGVLASFTPAIGDDPAAPGPVAYVGQSGALGGSFLDKAKERHLPVGTWVSTGNQVDLTAVELATGLVERDDVEVIALYLEDVGDGAAFVELARAARRRGKDLVVIRSGSSEVGRRAIQSHTGSMVSSHAVFEVIAHAEGVVIASDIDEMLDRVMVLLSGQRPQGRRVGIVSSSGGAGILVADQLSALGFVIPPLTDALQERLSEYVPAYGATRNPVDVTAQLFVSKSEDDRFGPKFRALCDHVAASDEIDVVIIVLTMLVGEPGLEMAEALDGLQEEFGKPVYVVWIASTSSTDLGRRRLAEERIPVFDNVPSLAASLGELARLEDAVHSELEPPPLRDDLPGPEQVRELLADPSGPMRLLDAWGVPQPSWRVAADVAGAEAAAAELTGPLVVKVLASGLAHKSDIGAVRLGVEAGDVGEVCTRMLERFDAAGTGQPFEGFLLQQMAGPGRELLIAVRRDDPSFPPVLTVGFGGIATEVYADVVTAPLPLAEGAARHMLSQLAGAPLLGAFRGREPGDVDVLVATIDAVSAGFLAAGDALDEIEVNPVIVHDVGGGVSAVDCLVVAATD